MYCRCRVSRQDGVGHNAGRDMSPLLLATETFSWTSTLSSLDGLSRAYWRLADCMMTDARRLANDTRREEADSSFAQVLNFWRQGRQLHRNSIIRSNHFSYIPGDRVQACLV